MCKVSDLAEKLREAARERNIPVSFDDRIDEASLNELLGFQNPRVLADLRNEGRPVAAYYRFGTGKVTYRIAEVCAAVEKSRRLR